MTADENAGCRKAAGDQDRLIAGFPEAAEDIPPVRENASPPFPGAAVTAGDEGGTISPAEKIFDQFADKRGLPRPSQGEISDGNERKGNFRGRFPAVSVSGRLPGADGPRDQGISLKKDSHFGKIYHRTPGMPISPAVNGPPASPACLLGARNPL